MARANRASRIDWFNLIEIDGPFLDPDVLRVVFPQGVGDWLRGDQARRRYLLDAFEEWTNQGFPLSLQRAWFDIVVRDGLRYPDERFLLGPAVPAALRVRPPDRPGVTLAPDAVLSGLDGKPLLLLRFVKPGEKPRSRQREGAVAGTPVEAMIDLLRHVGPANDLRLGLVTNGREWCLIHVAPGVTSSVITWDAALWREEPLAFDAFVALLEDDRFTNVPGAETLAALFTRSQDAPKQVTEQLGTQVRQAVEILVGAIDRADRERDGALLAGIEPATVYEAAISTMMRLIVLFYAEERGLLPVDQATYQETYAVGGILDWLDGLSQRFGDDEVLARRYDAWPRLLATFRAIHGGIDHDQLRLPAFGGTLFDPDRFPFLEGRAAGTSWRTEPARPIRVDNQTVRHLLSALQRLEGTGTAGARRLSFRSLDVEQIGHVYERLLDHTAVRASDPALGLTGKAGEEPEIALSTLEAELARGEGAFLTFLKDQTGRTERALEKLLANPPDPSVQRRLPEACNNDPTLRARVEPFASLLRSDRAGRPLVILAESVYVSAGQDRRASGAHYTPRALTEEIVKHALDPLVFTGPAEGLPEAEWRRKPARALLDLRICDPAMGSGAFLVQACRYLADHLVAAWDEAERQSGARVVTPSGDLDGGDPARRPLPSDADERLAIARRAVVDHCLFGVDKNGLAVEMAKLSLWLVTLQKDRPFTFLDHALRHGDSLLGISSLAQLTTFALDETPRRQGEVTFAKTTNDAVRKALRLRRQIAATPVEQASDAEEKTRLLAEAEEATQLAHLGADLLISTALIPEARLRDARRDELLHRYQIVLLAAEARGTFTPAGKAPSLEALAELRREAGTRLGGERPFHWPLEFPEVFDPEGERSGFDAFVGNPPFMGGQKITGAFGVPYRDYLVNVIAGGAKGSADLVAYFFLRTFGLLRPDGMLGLLATNTIAQGDTREVGLDRLIRDGASIPRAIPSRPWPGEATLEVAWLWLHRGVWRGEQTLDKTPVRGITPFLTTPGRATGMPYRLAANSGKSFIGSYVLGMGFVLNPEEAEALVAKDPRNRDVLFPYLNGEDLNSRPDESPSRWVINFHDWPAERAATYPACWNILEEKVRPERQRLNDLGAYVLRNPLPQRYWQYAEKRPALYSTIEGMNRVLVTARVSASNCVTWSTTRLVFHEKIVVFPFAEEGYFAVLQSSIHWEWARLYTSTLRDITLNYSPTDCFETLPLPAVTTDLNSSALSYYVARHDWMINHLVSLTSVSNQMHSERVLTQEAIRLRDLQMEMDHAVAAAYGWSDLDLGHGFHTTKQGVRFTISEDARQEVLDRLLELNHARYAEEVRQGLHEKGGKAGRRGGGKGKQGQAALAGFER